jgi:hypothetical protein
MNANHSARLHRYDTHTQLPPIHAFDFLRQIQRSRCTDFNPFVLSRRSVLPDCYAESEHQRCAEHA